MHAHGFFHADAIRESTIDLYLNADFPLARRGTFNREFPNAVTRMIVITIVHCSDVHEHYEQRG
jgi:hypothetical protein